MGIRIGIGKIVIGQGLVIPNWTQQLIDNYCLFFAGHYTNILNKVANTHLPNQVTGASDYLTVTGTGLDARYRTPDSDAYRTADSDYVFWKSDASESTCDGNRLIAYDFPRILVKYLNVSPYTILWIAILKPGVTVTDGMKDSFNLSRWWNNTLSFHGNDKQNKPLPQQYVWTAESTYNAASLSLFTRMTAVSETPTSTRKGIIDLAITADVADSTWAEYDAFWLMASHGVESSKLNYVKNAHNITPVGSPIFTEDRGWTGNSIDGGLNSNYKLSSNAVKTSRNSIAIGAYVRNNAQGLSLFSAENPILHGSYFTPRYSDNNKYWGLNSYYLNNGCTDSRGMWIITRLDATSVTVYHDKVGSLYALASEAMVDEFLFFLCRNLAGVNSTFDNHEIALGFVRSGMNQTDVNNFHTRWIDGVLNSIGAKI